MRFPYSGKSALICDGAVRSGKTSIMSLSYILWAMGNFSNQNFGICGKTVISAERNVIRPLMGIKYLRDNFSMRFANHILTVSRGCKTNTFYIFGGKDESSYMLIQGVTLAGVFLDEVALMPESFVDQALARCSVEGSKYWFNCNPEGPMHWFYREWILQPENHNAMHIHFLLDDNPSLSDEKKQEYYSNYTGVFYKRYILGMWVVAEGLVYQMFSEEKNVVKDVPASGRYWISVDYGIDHPFSAGLWCLSGGIATRVAEYYYDPNDGHKPRRTDEQHYEAVKKLAANHYIQRIVVDPSASSFIELAEQRREFAIDKAANKVIPGISYTSTLLNQGKIKIHESCADCIREFKMYSWDSKQPEDAVIKEFDHAMDDMRYFCYTILRNILR